jgi:hypothetical protein
MCGDEQIVHPNQRATFLQVGADLGIVKCRVIREVHRLKIRKVHSMAPCRRAPRAAIARWLATGSPAREAVKTAIAILGVVLARSP